MFVEFIEAHVNDKTSWLKSALEESNKSDDDSGVEEENFTQEDKKNPDNMINSNDSLEHKDKEKKSLSKVADSQISDLEVSCN